MDKRYFILVGAGLAFVGLIGCNRDAATTLEQDALQNANATHGLTPVVISTSSAKSQPSKPKPPPADPSAGPRGRGGCQLDNCKDDGPPRN